MGWGREKGSIQLAYCFLSRLAAPFEGGKEGVFRLSWWLVSYMPAAHARLR